MAERDAKPNTTAVYQERRRVVRKFRGPVSMVAEDLEMTHVRFPIAAQAALVVIDGAEQWVPIDDLSSWSDTKPVDA